MVYLCLIAYVVAIYVRPSEIWTDFPFVEAVAGLSLAAAGFSYLVRPRTFWDLPHDKFILGFGAAIVASNLSSGWFGGAVLGFSEFLKLAFYYFLIRFAVREEWQFRGLIRTLIAVNVVLAVSGIVQFHWGVGLGGVTLGKGERIRGSGLFNDPNDLALSLVMVVPFVLDPIISATRRSRRFLALSLLAVFMLAIYYTNSRSGALGLAVVASLYAFNRLGRFAATALVAVLLIGTLAWGPSRLRAPDSKAQESSQLRFQAWQAALVMFESDPLLGVGFGRFREFHVRAAHNSFAHVLAELGMLGAFFWVGIYYWLIKGALARPPTDTPPFVERWRTPLLLSIVGVLVCSWFISRQYVLYPYTLVGIGACYVSIARTQGVDIDLEISTRAGIHILSIMLAGIIIAYLATQLFIG